MEHPFILHMVTPLKHISPFDVNMAADAGFGTIATYCEVALSDVTGLVQDMIFSRAPSDARRTGLFIAGRDAGLALDMLDAAKRAMFPPFQISAFADPAGAFTTAAAMVGLAQRLMRRSGHDGLKGQRVKVFGATGVVGSVAGALAAVAGATVTLVGHRGASPVQARADALTKRFDLSMNVDDAPDGSSKARVLADADVVLACAKAGVQVLSADDLSNARRLKVAADINAVPPAGIEGLGAKDDGAPVGTHGAKGLGALAIGNIKFKTQHKLFEDMRAAEKPLALDFRQAFEVAIALAGS